MVLEHPATPRVTYNLNNERNPSGNIPNDRVSKHKVAELLVEDTNE